MKLPNTWWPLNNVNFHSPSACKLSSRNKKLNSTPLFSSLLSSLLFSSSQIQQKLDLFGYNKLEEKKESKILKFLGFMWNPLSWVMETTTVMAIAMAHGGDEGGDYQDFAGIVILLIINSIISFIEENNAGNVAAALMARLVPKAKILHDGKWNEEEASVLFPGDIISLKLGGIILTDAHLLEYDPLKIDQSAFSVESLPITKSPGDGVYFGLTCKQGEIEAVVIANGVHTFFGKVKHYTCWALPEGSNIYWELLHLFKYCWHGN